MLTVANIAQVQTLWEKCVQKRDANSEDKVGKAEFNYNKRLLERKQVCVVDLNFSLSLNFLS